MIKLSKSKSLLRLHNFLIEKNEILINHVYLFIMSSIDYLISYLIHYTYYFILLEKGIKHNQWIV